MAKREDHRRVPDDSAAPPPIKRGPAQPIMLISAAFVLFCILVLVVLNIDSGDDAAKDDPPEDIIELITPPGLTQEDTQRDSDGSNELQPELSRGGVVEIADEQTQELVQRYRFDSLDPNPEGEAPGWLRMVQPRLEIYLEDNRIVTLAGDSALAYRPHRAIESGTMTGNVVMRLFEGADGMDVDLSSDQPAWVVTTDEASLDNFLGEIRCDGDVLIESDTLTLPGKRLRVLVDDQSDRIELRIAQPQYIRLVSENGSNPIAAQPRRAEPPARFVNTSSGSASLAAYRQDDDARSQPDFYLLRISDDVVIKQGGLLNRRIARGDRLEVVFSSQSSGLNESLARHNAPVRTYTAPRPLHELLSTLVYAGIDDDPFADEDEQLLGPDVTLIRCNGPLTIEPLEDAQRQPQSPDDAHLELIGQPVTLTDAANDSRATGSHLTYHTGRERVELLGSDVHPVRLTSPELEAGGEKFVHHQQAHVAGIEGAGWMSHRTNVQDDADDAAADDAAPVTELHITWTNGMDLDFAETQAEGSGRLTRARFDGDVSIATDEFTMDATHVTVHFADDAGDEIDANSIDAIHARGEVRVHGVATAGAIHCDDLQLDLTRSAAGETIPQLMVATGNVHAIDDDQMIWSDRLRVRFREGVNEDGEPQVDELLAEDNVQVLLADGTRAFSDRLIGDGVSETVELTGEDVAIISDTMVMDRGKRLILDRTAGTATSPGPGSLRIFSEPVLEVDRSRIERPKIERDRPVDLSARWSQSMLYDSKYNEGAGSVDFRGDVDVQSRPSPLELSTMTGDSLTIEFVHTDDEPAQQASADDTGEATSNGLDEQRGSREISTFIARQDAKIESRTFTTPEHDGEPQIFYVAGDYVEYDALRTAALVAGKGELLIHDISPETQGEAPEASPFGAKGTTMVRWTRELRLTPRVDEVYDIIARGEVEMRHRDPEQAVSWMTCERLDATLRRRENTDAPVETDGLDAGGSAALERVTGTGGVIINTDRRTIDCDAFDYNVASGLAQLTATGRGIVSIQTEGSANVVTASQALWDMQRDSIRITRAAGAGGN